MNMCRIEFEDLEKWKAWFDTGEKKELLEALEIIESTVTLTTKNGQNPYSEARKPFIEYAEKKLGERFPGYEAEYIPF